MIATAFTDEIGGHETELPSFAVVVPVFNEKVGVERCVRAITAALARIGNPSRLIIVDDGSSDGTSKLLEELGGSLPGFTTIHHDENLGYGGGLMTGAREASGQGYDYVLFMDSDLTNPPEHIERFLTPMADGWDLIKGSRFDKGGAMEGVPAGRAFISRLGNLIAACLFRVGLKDCTNGFRAIRTGLFLDLPLSQRGFAIIVEELYRVKQAGGSITSVPTILYDRTADQRPTLFTYRPSVFAAYLRYALLASLLSSRPENQRDDRRRPGEESHS